jgi:ribosomal protein S19
MVNRYVSVSPVNFFWKRNSLLNKKLLNKRICIFNGKLFHIINTNINFRGFRLGEFSVSRKRPIHKGKQRQLKKVFKKTERKKR